MNEDPSFGGIRPPVNPAWEGQSIFDGLAIHAHQGLFDAELKQGTARTLNPVRGAAAFGVVLGLIILLETLTLPLVATDPAIHIIIGVALIPALVIKLGYSGIRFVRYYREDEETVRIGPPFPLARVIAPLLVATTVLLVGSGLEMTFAGPTSFSVTFLAPAHFLIAIVWYVLLASHGYVYWRRSQRSIRRDLAQVLHRFRSREGARMRIGLALVSLIIGAALATPVHSEISRWTQAAKDPSTITAAPVPLTYYSPYARKLGEKRHALKYKIGLENRTR